MFTGKSKHTKKVLVHVLINLVQSLKDKSGNIAHIYKNWSRIHKIKR